jgi:hypothetical protein
MRFISDRISIEEDSDKLSVIIFGKTDRWKESMLLFWLLSWSFSGSVFFYYFLANTPYQYSLPMLILIAFWAYFEIKIARVFLWRRFGFEHIEFSGDSLLIKNNLKGYGKKQKFNIRQIQEFKEIIQSNRNFFAFMDQSFWVIGGDKIYFLYNNRDIIFGKQIDEREEKALLFVLNGRLNKAKSKLRKKERESNE